MKSLSAIIAQPVTSPLPREEIEKSDEYDIFAKLIAVQLRGLSKRRYLMAQNAIQNILFCAMIEDQEGRQSSTGSISQMSGHHSNVGSPSNLSLPHVFPHWQ